MRQKYSNYWMHIRCHLHCYSKFLHWRVLLILLLRIGGAWRKYILQRNIINVYIIIIIIILGISFMQGIYTYIPETNHVRREYCVATILM
jgi:hypothetical protein